MSLKHFLWFFLAVFSHASPITSLIRKDDAFPYQLLKKTCINQDCSATRITISNPPINLNTTSPSNPKLIVISSDVPDFFIAAIDLHLLSAAHPVPASINVTDTLNKYYENLSLLSSIPVIFVAEINGRAFGAGDEHAMHMDMRFAGPGAIFSAPEAAVGLIHVGAMQWLVESLGPSRTMEFMLSSAQVNATEAERVGWVNSAYTTAEGLRDHVDTLVTRVAKFETEAIIATKKSVAQQKPTKEMFEADQAAFVTLASEPVVQATVDKLLELSNDQAIVWELNNSDNIVDYVV
jgi:enoyl-CoA hydratase/carnithine racemase